jgi:hypothetical protein
MAQVVSCRNPDKKGGTRVAESTLKYIILQRFAKKLSKFLTHSSENYKI